jgi:hypothetical protein
MIHRKTIFCLLLAGLVGGCSVPLKEAKLQYARAQELSRRYQTESAVAAYKRTLVEAELASRRNPSAQAFMLKGLAEVRLDRWAEAGESFRRAFAFGFASGEEWASDASLLGMAYSFEMLGLRESAGETYIHILRKSRFRPVLTSAAQKHVDLVLSRALGLEDKERDRALAGLLKDIGRLLDVDYACGFFHYLSSQVLSHTADYRRCYEEAVMARELGLPSFEILRDNDNQIVYCWDNLESALPPSERNAFVSTHDALAEKWGWKDARTPGWKER